MSQIVARSSHDEDDGDFMYGQPARRRGRRRLRDNGGGDFDDLGFDRRKREGFLNSPWDCGLVQDRQ
jgi:hypothetical protein